MISNFKKGVVTLCRLRHLRDPSGCSCCGGGRPAAVVPGLVLLASAATLATLLTPDLVAYDVLVNHVLYPMHCVLFA